MPGSRSLKNVMRGSKGPKSGSSEKDCARPDASSGGGTSKQYNQTGKKYTGPNYPQSQETGAGSGKIKIII